MSTNELIGWIFLAITLLGGLSIGFVIGFLCGYNKGTESADGWQDEALWWREHTLTIKQPISAEELSP